MTDDRRTRNLESLRVAVIGATGLVGREIVQLLGERRFPVGELRLYASERSAGEEVEFGDRTLRVERLPQDLPAPDVVFLCANGDVSQRIGRDLADEGAVVLDLTPAHRGDTGTPMVTAAGPLPSPPTNSEGILVVFPDAAVVLLSSALRAIASLVSLRRIQATVLAPASSYGTAAIEHLGRASAALLSALEPEEEGEGRPPLAFSCLPVDGMGAGASSADVGRDLVRVLGIECPIIIRTARVPTFHGCTISLSIETGHAPDPDELLRVLREAPSILVDEGEERATGSREAVGSDGIHLSEIRVEPGEPAWVHLWLTADNLRPGAALGAVAVAEALLRTPSGVA